MNILDTLITDRTEEDVERAAELSAKGIGSMEPGELAEFLSGMKGAYNATDLNRVEAATVYVAERLRGYGYAVTLQTGRTWADSDIPTPAMLAPYLSNVAALMDALSVFETTPRVLPDMENFTWQEANNIEKILLDIERLLTLMAQSFQRCGATGAICGVCGIPAGGAESTENLIPRTWAELDATGWGWAEWNTKTWTQLAYKTQ